MMGMIKHIIGKRWKGCAGTAAAVAVLGSVYFTGCAFGATGENSAA